jgi:hypothetical protein
LGSDDFKLVMMEPDGARHDRMAGEKGIWNGIVDTIFEAEVRAHQS